MEAFTGPAASPTQTITVTTTPPPIDQVVANNYDGLYRLTQANYSGTLEATYGYAYDPVGNRVAYTTTITSTEVMTYRYDAANQLLESVVIGGDTTTYTWDHAGRLITTTLAGQISRIYQYSQDGDLISAVVDGLTTTFAYDGDGRRLLMSVDGQVTTYTHDYRSGNRVLFEQGVGETKHYLYGLQCLGEQVTDTETSQSEWRYYQYDGNSLVRQTTDEEAAITLAWTYSPEGAVLIGEEGPVTHLGCEGDATYDWSTGLIYKRGRYFDPTTSIWVSLSPAIIWQAQSCKRGFSSKKRKGKKNSKRLLLILLLLLFMLLLTSCGNGGTATPTGDTRTDESGHIWGVRLRQLKPEKQPTHQG